DNCRLSDYQRLKTKILNLHDQRYMETGNRGGHKDNMATRKKLVDLLFKRFDADGSGRVDSSELSQVIKQEGLSKDVSECTLFDLLKYNDINDDEHLTKAEFYTAFGEWQDQLQMLICWRSVYCNSRWEGWQHQFIPQCIV
ncbi:unnamed protein product, partial [Coregonus sp. 'balchen']